MMNEVTIRQAQSIDTEAVSSILQEAARWLIDRGIPLWKVDKLEPEQIQPDVSSGLFWLANIDGTAAGCVYFQTEGRMYRPVNRRSFAVLRYGAKSQAAVCQAR